MSINGRTVRRMGPDEFFGEIALLRDVPRSATVTSTRTTKLFALQRSLFLEAVTGHSQSRDVAEHVAQERLDRKDG